MDPDRGPVILLSKGRYDVHMSQGRSDTCGALDLRRTCFPTDALTGDTFDGLCAHIAVVDRQTGACVAALRMLDLPSGSDIGSSYSAQFYDLSALHSYQGRILEIGRFCVHPACTDPDALRVIWAALASYVDANDVRFLFGCSSFAGLDPSPYRGAFAAFRDRYLAPSEVAPRRTSETAYDFADHGVASQTDLRALAQVPPLLRMYLSLGGWVSDHAVVDPQMNTLHVFTGLEVSAIPEGRKRVLRSIVGSV